MFQYFPNTRSKALYPNFWRHIRSNLPFTEEKAKVRKQELFKKTSHAYFENCAFWALDIAATRDVPVFLKCLNNGQHCLLKNTICHSCSVYRHVSNACILVTGWSGNDPEFNPLENEFFYYHRKSQYWRLSALATSSFENRFYTERLWTSFSFQKFLGDFLTTRSAKIWLVWTLYGFRFFLKNSNGTDGSCMYHAWWYIASMEFTGSCMKMHVTSTRISTDTSSVLNSYSRDNIHSLDEKVKIFGNWAILWVFLVNF